MKSFIFDMDGTLFQTDKILEASLDETFKYLRSQRIYEGITPIETYRNIMGAPLQVVWENLLPSYSIEIRQKSNDLFHDNLISTINEGKGELYPHVIEIFDFLKKNDCDIYIASNGQVSYLRAIAEFYLLDKWVTEIFSIQQIDSQNKSDLVKEIILKHNITEGAVIGDRLSDIKAAKDNKLLSIGCSFDFAQEAELSQADIIIDSFLNLKQLLKPNVILSTD